MKTIKSFSKVTMLLAFVAFANTLMAAGNLRLNILPLNSERAVVAITNNEAANFQISIEDKKGEKIFYKETRSDNNDYRKIYDFSELENGEYKMTVTINGDTAERTFNINDSNITVSKEKKIEEPYFSYIDGVLKVSYLNFSEEKLNLNFYKDNELVYSKSLGNKFNVIEGYDLSKLEEGVYSVVLAGNDKTFTYGIDIK